MNLLGHLLSRNCVSNFYDLGKSDYIICERPLMCNEHFEIELLIISPFITNTRSLFLLPVSVCTFWPSTGACYCLWCDVLLLLVCKWHKIVKGSHKSTLTKFINIKLVYGLVFLDPSFAYYFGPLQAKIIRSIWIYHAITSCAKTRWTTSASLKQIWNIKFQLKLDIRCISLVCS